MEIFKLLKANIKHKKGSFKSIAIIMMLIVISYSVTLSNNDNLDEGINRAHEAAGISQLSGIYDSAIVDNDFIEAVKSEGNIESVTTVEALNVMPEAELCIDGQSVSQNVFLYSSDSREYSVLNSDFSGFAVNPPALEKGEIYLPYRFVLSYDAEIGSEVTLKNGNSQVKFTVAGFVEEPVFGAIVFLPSYFFVSDEDFSQLHSNSDGNTSLVNVVRVNTYFKSDSASEAEIKNELNAKCGFVEKAMNVISQRDIKEYTKLYASFGTTVLNVFVILLIVIAVISMCSSIGTVIEMEYTNLGILKSQGFTSAKIRMIYLLQYIIAELIGAAAGIILSIPLTVLLGGLFQPITGIFTTGDVSFGRCILLALGIILLCSVFVVIATAKVSNISPVRAISGGKADVYFDSRFNAPIKAKPLSFFMGLRQFTSRKKNYIGSMLIGAILVFFMMSIIVLTSCLNSEMIVNSVELSLSAAFTENYELGDEAEIEETILEADSEATVFTGYVSPIMVDGAEYLCHSYSKPDLMYTAYEGRLPMYDNEAAITEIVAEEIGKSIGDTIILGSGESQREFIITGYFQTITELGRLINITSDGRSRFDGTVPELYIELSDNSLTDDIVKRLESDYPHLLDTIVVNDETGENNEALFDIIDLLLNIVVISVFTVSIIFAAVVINMVCSKTFIRERTDTGIFKSVGFTSSELRMQFSFRFLIIAVLGSAIGGICSAFFTQPMLSAMMKMIGLTRIDMVSGPLTFILPAAAICISFMVFSFISSAKIRAVEIRELISE